MTAVAVAPLPRKRVTIYHPWVYLKSGLERTLMEIKRRSRHDWTILTSHYDADGTYPDLKSMGVQELKRVSVKRRYGTVLRVAATIATTRLDPDSYDVLFVSCDGLGSLLTFRNHAKPVACICFTPLRAVYDEEYRARHLSRNSKLLPLAFMLEQGYKWLDRRAWRHYDRVFCISEAVRTRVLKGTLCPRDKTDIAYPGIDESLIAPSETFEPFFFLPGRIMWTKNIELGIEAFQKLTADRAPEFRLIIAGMVDEKSRPYLEQLRALAAGDSRIEFVVSPSEEAMRDLYRRCYALLFTAFNEDLGLTPLEAMTAGKPTIAVDRGGPREIVADRETGRLVDATPEAFAAAMQEFIDRPDLVKDLGRRGLTRCRKFTWDTYLDQLDRYIDQTGFPG